MLQQKPTKKKKKSENENHCNGDTKEYLVLFLHVYGSQNTNEDNFNFKELGVNCEKQEKDMKAKTI